MRFRVVLLTCVVALLPSAVFAQADSEELVGLQAIRFKILLDRDLADLERVLQTRMEVRLRQAGLRIVEWSSTEREAGIILSSITLNSVNPGVNQTKFELSRWAKLPRAGASELLTLAVVWKRDRLTVVRVDERAAVQAQVEELVDMFLNEYLKANPKR